MRAGRRLITARDALGRGRLPVATAERARRHACGCRGCTASALRFLGVELVCNVVRATAGHPAVPPGSAVRRPFVTRLRGLGRRSSRCGRGGGRRARRGGHRRARLRPDRRGDHNGCRNRNTTQEMLHASILSGSVAVPDRDSTLQRPALFGVALAGLGSGTSRGRYPIPEHATRGCRVSELAGVR